MLDKNTFGDAQCAINLARILNEFNDLKVTRKVTRYLTQTNALIKATSEIPHPKLRRAVFTMIRRCYIVDCTMILPEIVKTHMQNVAMTHLRVAQQHSKDFDVKDFDIGDYPMTGTAEFLFHNIDKDK